MLDNIKPDLLADFVSSVIWRHAMSRHYAQYDMDLGPWEVQLRQRLFHGASYEPRFYVTRQRWMSGSDHLKELIVPPYRNPAWGRRGWEFEVGGLLFVIILDHRHRHREMRTCLANGKREVLIVDLPDRNLVERPGMIDIAVNMLARTAASDRPQGMAQHKATTE